MALVAHVPDELDQPASHGLHDRLGLRGTADDSTVEYEYIDAVSRSGEATDG